MKTHLFIDKATRKPRIPKSTEYQIHCAIADFLNLNIKKPSRWTTIEVSNQASGKAAMFKQIALKRKGVTTGFPDILIIRQSESFLTELTGMRTTTLIFLEVKVPGGKLTDKQEALHKELREEGHSVFIVHGAEETKEYLKSLGAI